MSKKLWHFFFKNLKLPLHLNLELSNVALSHVLPYFPILMLSLLHLVIFRHSYLTQMKSDSGNFQCHELVLHFSYIHRLDFSLKEIFLLSNSKKIMGSNKFCKVFPCRDLFFLENQDDLHIRIQSSHSYTLACCRPIHLISIEFQNTDIHPSNLPKKLFLLLQLL